MKSFRTLAVVAVAIEAQWLAGAPAAADFVSIVIVDDTTGLDGLTLLTDIPGYSGQRVLNVFMQFDDSTDQGIGVVGSPGNPFEVRTLGGTGFINSPLPGGGGPPPPGLALKYPALNYDSFFTIGMLEGAGVLIIAPGTPGPNTDPWPVNPATAVNMAWSVPPTIGGLPTPQSIAGPTGRVLIMRLVVQPEEEVEGHFGILKLDRGGLQEIGVTMATGLPGACCLPEKSCIEGVSAEACAGLSGAFLGSASICLPGLSCTCPGMAPCVADLSCDGAVNVPDLLIVILDFGCTGPPACPGDVDANGVVDVGDVIMVILEWGPCP